MVDWSSLTELYDSIGARRALRASLRSKSSGPQATKEWSSKWIEYSINQINGTWLASTFQGTTNLNMSCSSEHIADVILRQYKHLIHPFKVPFRHSEFVPEAVWQAMVAKVEECKTYHRMWIESEREEFWNRPDISSTDVVYICMEESDQPTMTLVKKGKVPVLRIRMGVT